MDVVSSSGRQHRKSRTRPDGVHALFAFATGLSSAPDWGDNEYRYDPEELDGHDDWETVSRDAFVFEDDSGGEPHRHAAEERVFRTPA